MTKPNAGGPAFPRKLPDVMVPPARALEMLEEYSGMTLRDYFAGQALVLCTDPTLDEEETADICGRVADAMLAERSLEG